MKCNEIEELLEEFIMKELDKDTEAEVEGHLKECRQCKEAYEEFSEMISIMKNFKHEGKIKEGVLNMGKREVIKGIRKERGFMTKVIPTVAACMFLVTTILAGSVLAFPAFAAKVAPELPVVKEMKEVQLQNNEVKQQVEAFKKENEELKMMIKEIKGAKITEIQSGPSIAPEENAAIQELVINFIRAQYKGDLDSIKGMCTEEFKKTIDQRKEEILNNEWGEIMFSTITNVAKEGDKYLVFVRLNDTAKIDDADYQEDFELVKVNGKFLVSFMGKDA